MTRDEHPWSDPGRDVLADITEHWAQVDWNVRAPGVLPWQPGIRICPQLSPRPAPLTDDEGHFIVYSPHSPNVLTVQQANPYRRVPR